jgi:hypothetical protein
MFRIVACSIMIVAATNAPLMADGYTKWVADPKTQTISCDYEYQTKDNRKAYQKVVIYAADPERKTWAYFYNAKNEPWARCAVPGNPKYDPKVMTWQRLEPTKKDRYVDYPEKGFCPAPGDGKAPILNLPLPPK